jgi:hypothetical protein
MACVCLNKCCVSRYEIIPGYFVCTCTAPAPAPLPAAAVFTSQCSTLSLKLHSRALSIRTTNTAGDGQSALDSGASLINPAYSGLASRWIFLNFLAYGPVVTSHVPFNVMEYVFPLSVRGRPSDLTSDLISSSNFKCGKSWINNATVLDFTICRNFLVSRLVHKIITSSGW